MEQARAAGRQLLGTLRPEDRFRLIDFSSDVRTFRDDFVSATSGEPARRESVSRRARGAGRNEHRRRAARSDATVAATDGPAAAHSLHHRRRADGRRAARRPAGGDRRRSRRARTRTRRIFTFGLGSDVNVTLLEQLALEGRGTAQFVRPDESVERMVGVVANRLVDPVLTDVRVRVEGDVRLSQACCRRSRPTCSPTAISWCSRATRDTDAARIIVEGNAARRAGAVGRRPSTFPSASDRTRSSRGCGRRSASACPERREASRTVARVRSR